MSGSSDEAAASVEALLDFCEEVEEHEEPPAVDKNRLEHWNRETWWAAFLNRSNTLFPKIGFLPETANVSAVMNYNTYQCGERCCRWRWLKPNFLHHDEKWWIPGWPLVKNVTPVRVLRMLNRRSLDMCLVNQSRPDVLTFPDLFTVSELGLEIQDKLLWIRR